MKKSIEDLRAFLAMLSRRYRRELDVCEVDLYLRETKRIGLERMLAVLEELYIEGERFPEIKDIRKALGEEKPEPPKPKELAAAAVNEIYRLIERRGRNYLLQEGDLSQEAGWLIEALGGWSRACDETDRAQFQEQVQVRWQKLCEVEIKCRRSEQTLATGRLIEGAVAHPVLQGDVKASNLPAKAHEMERS